jgi:murein DD-endopeptidase MepM/ murein hydrolase activator NlpD
MRYVVLIFLLTLVSCATKSQEKPSFISFERKDKNIEIFAKNELACPTHVIIENLNDNESNTIEFKAFEKKKILTSEKDTIKIFKDYKFRMLYGNSYPLKSYDTLYNYGLPFLKGKRYKIIQGQNTNFTHKGFKSKYAIDFRMNIGQTVCAMKGGVVVSVKEDSNKGGRNKKYLNDGNYVMLYHNDGLFTQYVHLKKDGVLVKKGDSVKKGQPIAYSGNTGMSTEPHLHFGVFKPTPKGFTSIPYTLDSIPTKRYKKGKFALNN